MAEGVVERRLAQLDREIEELQPKLDALRSAWAKARTPEDRATAKEIYEDLKEQLKELLAERRALEAKLPVGAGPGPSSAAAGVAGPGPSSAAADGAGPGPSSAEMEEACLRAIKRSKVREESVSVFKVGVTQWGNITRARGLAAVQSAWLESLKTSSSSPPPFSWTDEPENKQSDRYMPHLKQLFPLSGERGTASKLAWLACGDNNKDLLTVIGDPDSLYYGKIAGTTDAAIVTQAGLAVNLPKTGLCILFELKKAVGEGDVYQGLCQLLLANIQSPSHRPVVVLTDLREDWRLLWLDGRSVTVGRWTSSAAAVAMIKSLVEAADELADAPLKAPANSPPACVKGIPGAIVERKPLPDGAGGGGGEEDVADLADLEGLLPEAELKAARAGTLLQQLMRVPAVSFMAHSHGGFPARLYA